MKADETGERTPISGLLRTSHAQAGADAISTPSAARRTPVLSRDVTPWRGLWHMDNKHTEGEREAEVPAWPGRATVPGRSDLLEQARRSPLAVVVGALQPL